MEYKFKGFNGVNSYIKFKILIWIMEYLNKDFIISVEKDIGNLLCFLSIQEVTSIYNLCMSVDFELFGDEYDTIIKISESKLSDLIEVLDNNWSDPKFKNVKKKIYDLLSKHVSMNWEVIYSDPLRGRIAQIKSIYNLNKSETEFLEILFAESGNFIDESGFLNSFAGSRDSFNQCTFAESMRSYYNINRHSIKSIWSEEGRLIKNGIIYGDFDIRSYILDYLNEGWLEGFSSLFYKKYSEQTFTITVSSSNKVQKSIVESIIRSKKADKGINILFYGPTGSGKSNFVRFISKELNKKLYVVNKNCGDYKRLTALTVCQNTVKSNYMILMSDAYDELKNVPSLEELFSDSSDKKYMLERLTTHKNVIFWTVPDIEKVDSDFLEKFDYCLEFSQPLLTNKSSIWVDNFSNLPSEDLRIIAESYEIPNDDILRIAKIYRGIKSEKSITTLRSILDQHMLLKGVNTVRKSPITRKYCLEAINIKGDNTIIDGLNVIKGFSEYIMSPSSNLDDVRNMNLLLYGPSGTGKTEFVKYISHTTGRKLLIKKGSDIIASHVGETERNLALAFKEAESNNAILFFDEADGFLQNRNKSMRIWETTQVNELLIQMENFSGIFICATNFLENADSAALRRFNLKYEFDYLKKDGVIKFFELYLMELSNKPLKESEKRDLNNLRGLTPGDFKVVKQKNIFLQGRDITNIYLINELKREVEIKGVQTSKIGFSA